MGETFLRIFFYFCHVGSHCMFFGGNRSLHPLIKGLPVKEFIVVLIMRAIIDSKIKIELLFVLLALFTTKIKFISPEVKYHLKSP